MNKPRPIQNGLLFFMKVTLIHLLITTFTIAMAHAVDSMGQEVLERKVTINVQNTEIQTVLSLLKDQARVKFTYSPQLIDADRKVTIQMENARLADVLANLLSPEISYKVIGRQISLKPTAKAAEANDTGASEEASSLANFVFPVTGTIVDETGTPLPGVNVIVKGTTQGTTSDADGKFTIDLPEGDEVLVFSFIGYATQEVAVNGQSTINVTLIEDIQSLNEVVVVGYGTQEKREVTGAIAQVSSKELIKSSAISVSNALAGRVPGLIVNQTSSEPGRDDARIFIRGQGTTGNTEVLVVVDGIANRDGISRIDPNDIETITVLKDASAAIYGAQAANGVILITTKRGKTGKPTINYSFNQGFVSPTRKVKLADAALYARSVNTWSTQGGGSPIYTDEQINAFRSGASPSTDWIDEAYKSHSLQSRHSLTLSGGSEAVKYFISTGMADQNGLITGDETTRFRQYNVRTNIDAQISRNLKVGLTLAGRRENRRWLQESPEEIYGGVVRAAPDISATIGGLPAAGRENRNALAIAKGPGYESVEKGVYNGTLSGEYKIPGVEGLAVDGFAAIDIFDDFGKTWYQRYTYYADNNNDGVLEPYKSGPSIDQTYLRQDYQRAQSVTLNAKVKYDRTFGLHNVAGFLAYEQNEVTADTSYIQRRRFESDAIDQLYAGSSNTANHSNDGWRAETARQNYFGRIAYTFNEKYMAQFHFRYDGSYKFPADQRWGFFPGVSLGWRISEESFLSSSQVVSNLKLRGSWGQLGNDRVNAFQYLNLYNYGTTTTSVLGGNNAIILVPGVSANPNITWETKTTLNIGLDGGFFADRLTFELDVFSEKRNDILAVRNITVPDYTGLNLPNENIGKMNNRGIEGQVMYRNTIGAVAFNVGGNVTYARNKIVFIDEGNTYPEAYQKAEGHSIGSQLAYDYIGVYRTQEDLDTYPGLNGVARLGDPIYRDVNDDGAVTNADRVRIDRNNIPQIQYGINLGAQYKGFDLSVLFQGQGRVYQYLRYSFSNGNNGLEYFLENAWSEENPDASLPAINRGNSVLSTLWLRDVSFLRLKNIELGYTLPRDLVSKVGIQNLRVYCNGFNLLTFDKLKKDGLTDPESVNIEGWQFPHTKSINFGLNLTF